MYSYRLQVFHAVATTGSFSRAAREILHISQPAVSKHVQALEEELGVSLQERPHLGRGNCPFMAPLCKICDEAWASTSQCLKGM